MAQELVPWDNLDSAIAKSMDFKHAKTRSSSKSASLLKSSGTGSRENTPGFKRTSLPFGRPAVVRSNRSNSSRRLFDQSNYSSQQSRNSKANFASRRTGQLYSSNTSEHMSFANPEGRPQASKVLRPSNFAKSFLARVEGSKPKKQEQLSGAPPSGRTGLTPGSQPGSDIKNITFGAQFKQN